MSATIFLFLPNDSKTEVGHGLSQLSGAFLNFIGPLFQVLGAPWIHYGSGWLFPRPMDSGVLLAAGIIGALGFLPGLYFVLARYRSPRATEPAELVAFGVMLFGLGSIVLIVIGRGGIMAASPREVLAPRYCFWTPFFWAALPVLAFYRWPRLQDYSAVYSLLALALAVGAIPSQLKVGAAYAHGAERRPGNTFRSVRRRLARCLGRHSAVQGE